MTKEERTALEGLDAFTVQHVICAKSALDLVNLEFRTLDDGRVAINAYCRNCKATTTATVTLEAIKEQHLGARLSPNEALDKLTKH